MNDDSVHDFFTPKYLLKMLQASKYKYIEMLLPCVVLNVVFYDQYISRKDRIIALLIGFYFVFYLSEAINTNKTSREKNPSFKDENCVWETYQFIDYLNLCIQLIKILSEVEGVFATSRTGTLDDEHLFAAVRRISSRDETSCTNLSALYSIIACRTYDEEHNTKKSHTIYPPALVEKEPYKFIVENDPKNYLL